MRLTTARIAAYRQKLSTPLESGCFLWVGAKRNDGYGVMKFGGTLIKVHRIAWVIAHQREVPGGLVIDHQCGNKLCCNPAHLEAISQTANIQRREERAPLTSLCRQGHEHPRGRPCQLCAKENVRRWKTANPERWEAIRYRYESKRAKTRWQWRKEYPNILNPEIIS